MMVIAVTVLDLCVWIYMMVIYSCDSVRSMCMDLHIGHSCNSVR